MSRRPEYLNTEHPFVQKRALEKGNVKFLVRVTVTG